MTAFKGLLWKDFHISKGWFVICLSGEIAFLVIPYVMGLYMDNPLIFIPFALIMLLGIHIFFAPGMMLQMLNLEGKTQIWLHNPQSSKRLFISKVIVCTVYQLISQLLLTVIGTFIYLFYKDDFVQIGTNFFAKATTVLNFSLLLTGLFLTCITMFYWSIYHSLGKFSMIKIVRWLMLILIFISYNLVTGLLSKIDLFHTLNSKWTISITLEPQFTYEQGMWAADFQLMNFPVLLLIYYSLLGLGLFLFSSWLLDRKVEV